VLGKDQKPENLSNRWLTVSAEVPSPPRSAIAGWLPVSLTSVVASVFFLTWLFFPPVARELGPITLRKEDVVRFLPLVLVLIFDPRRLVFRWHWIDVPVIVYCLCPLVCGLANHLDWRDSLWETVKEFGYWFVPYFLGRAIFRDAASRRSLAIVVLIAAACYVPPTVFEIFNGPELTAWVTGHELSGQNAGAARGTTFRPSVFLSSGFVLTMFYVLATLMAVGLAWAGADSTFNSRWLYLAAFLCVVVVLACKSLGSIVLLGVGLITMLICRWTRVRYWLIPLAMVAPLYIGMRSSGLVTTNGVHAIAAQLVSADRAGSLAYRLRAEDIVFQRMHGHWWLGFGDFGLWRQDAKVMALDGFWLFALTRTGTLSVVAWLAMVTIPIVIRACSRKDADGRTGWISLTFALFLALSLVDSMLNYFGDAPQMLLVGVVSSQAAVVNRKFLVLR